MLLATRLGGRLVPPSRATTSGDHSPERAPSLQASHPCSDQFAKTLSLFSYTVYVEDPSDKQSPQDWLHLLGALLDYDGYARLNAIRSPTLVICGDEDRLAPHSDAKKLAAGIRGAVLEVVPGGHLMNIESPAAFIGHILWFLMGNSVQPSVRMDCPMLSA
jgi:pimeloyl-ACP methyl ester carboxylesterase